MAIRFRCPSCAQPIEIDDEWAAKSVACPYCRKTVTAPEVSTFEGQPDIPTARPGAPAAPTMEYPASVHAQSPSANKNPCAVAAAILVGCMFFVILLEGMVVSANELEFRELGERMQKVTDSEEGLAGVFRAQLEYYEERGGMPQWMITLALLHLLLMGLWLAALVCAIIGLRRPARRGLAIGSLAMCGLVPVLACCSPPF